MENRRRAHDSPLVEDVAEVLITEACLQQRVRELGASFPRTITT